MQKIVSVSSKGQEGIRAKIRRKQRITKNALTKEQRGKIILEPAKSFEDSFGDGGEAAKEAAIELSQDRRKEAKLEYRKSIRF
jgi:hypothetical protein